MATSIHLFRAGSTNVVLKQSKASVEYLMGGAMPKEQLIALAAMNDRISWDDAMGQLKPMIERSIRQDSREALDALHLAFTASGDWDRAKITRELASLHEFAWERFDELTAGLRLSLEAEGLRDHVALVDRIIEASDDLADPERLSELSWEWLSNEMATLKTASPVQLHASREMRELLAVPTDYPDPETVRWLLANRTADNQPIPGKSYKPFQASPAPDMTRLYRVGPTPAETAKLRAERPVSEWLAKATALSGQDAAAGRWFTHSLEEAEWYRREHPDYPLRYVDVRTEALAEFRAVNQPGARDFTSRPDHDFFLPTKFADRARAVEGAKRTMFFEVCFAPPKCTSISWAFSPPEMRAAIRAAHEAAVDKAMESIAEHLGHVRLGRAGSKGREAGEIAWITFGGQHTFNRKGEPQLHTHVAILNVVRSLESQRVGSLDLRALHGHWEKRTFDQIYQQELASGMTAIGVEIEMDVHQVARITGFPQKLLDAFSTRTQEAKDAALAKATANGLSFEQLTPTQKARWTDNMAAQQRQAKENDPPDFDKWVKTAIAAVGTEEWNRMAAARGWVHQRRSVETERIKEAKERWAAGLAAEYHRGGSREMEWGLSR